MKNEDVRFSYNQCVELEYKLYEKFYESLKNEKGHTKIGKRCFDNTNKTRKILAAQLLVVYGNTRKLSEEEKRIGYFLKENISKNDDVSVELVCDNPEVHIKSSLIFSFKITDEYLDPDDEILDITHYGNWFDFDTVRLTRHFSILLKKVLDDEEAIIKILSRMTHEFDGESKNVGPIIRTLYTWHIEGKEPDCLIDEPRVISKSENKDKFKFQDETYTAIIKLKDLSNGEYKDSRAFDRINGLINLFSNNFALMRFIIHGRSLNEIEVIFYNVMQINYITSMMFDKSQCPDSIAKYMKKNDYAFDSIQICTKTFKESIFN